MTRKTSFFTLLELLIVITIVALLATMLFPAVNGIKDSAMRMNCFNKVKNLAVENQRFSQSHDGRVALDSGTLFEKDNELRTATPYFATLSWYMWLAADGMGFPLYGDGVKKDPYGEGYGDSEPGDRTSLPGAEVERITQYRDGPYTLDSGKTPPNGTISYAGGPGDYYYSTGHMVFWNFICDEVLPCAELMSWGPHGDMLYERKKWERVYPLYAYCAGGTAGSFNINMNFYDESLVIQQVPAIWSSDGDAGVVRRSILTQAGVKSPSVRAYIAECSQGGTELYFSTTGLLNLNGKPYVPGFGAAGPGRDLYERMKNTTLSRFSHPFTGKDSQGNSLENRSTVVTDTEALEQEIYAGSVLHVEEGRHSGYTLHGFYDGHAEMLSAMAVGNLQTQKAVADARGWMKYMTGPYGDPTKAGEYQEGLDALKGK